MGIGENRKGTLLVEMCIAPLTENIPRHIQADLNDAEQLRMKRNYIMLGDTNGLRIKINMRY